ncbi:MAG: serine hydrolase domain-containing protein [Pseudomonadota bacterium]
MTSLIAHRAEMGAPALSAAVAVDSKVVWRGAVGWADIKSKRAVDVETLFRIGSTSKAITATALAQLVQDGALNLDAPIGNYLQPMPNPQWHAITARQLASHMAGIPNYGDNRDWLGLYQTIKLDKHYPDVRKALSLFDGSPLLHQPGSQFEYSSLGTVLLGAVMSAAAGKSYRQIISDRVLAPSEMTGTRVAPMYHEDGSNLARFYLNRNGRIREWRPVDLSHRLPGGGFVSTPTDLARMGARWLDDAYVSASTRAVFWKPQTLNDGSVNAQNYALGWRWREWTVDGVGLARNANHGGVSRGAQCWLLVFPDFQLSIAFAINTRTDEFHQFGALYEPLLRAFVDTYQQSSGASLDAPQGATILSKQK